MIADSTGYSPPLNRVPSAIQQGAAVDARRSGGFQPPRVQKGLLLVLGAVLLLVSCGKERRVDQATREGILLLGNGSEPKALDPHLVSSTGDSNVLRALFEGLVTNDPINDGAHAPGVAKTWVPNADFSEWTFHLRDDARWSNGAPVTADDFVYSFHRILHPDMASPYASMLYFLKNGEAYNTDEKKILPFTEVGVKAVDPHTLVCTLEYPAPYFPDVVKHTSWLPVHGPTLEKFGKMTDHFTDWQKPGNHVSNGAFQLADWKINAYVKVRRNPHYWDKVNVKPNGINFLPIDNSFTEERAFRGGLIHYTYSLPSNMIEWYQKKQPEVLHIETYAGIYFLRCNTTKKPTDNINFRRALAHAIDQEMIVKYVTLGGQQPASGFTPPSEGGYQPPAQIKFDPGLARKYLKEAGYQSGAEVPSFTILINTSEAHKAIAEAIQDMWKKHLGLKKVDIANQEWKVFQQTCQDIKYDVARAGWIGDYADPSTFLNMWKTRDSNNYTGWSNPEYDRLIKESAQLSNTEQRYAKLYAAEQVLLNELPVLPLYWYTRVYLISPDVENWNPLLLDNHPYKHIGLRQAGIN
jgi:oligopeptide transport system substrate-binding protein